MNNDPMNCSVRSVNAPVVNIPLGFVSMLRTPSLHFMNSQTVTAFNNRTSVGSHLPIYNDTSGNGDLNSFRREDSLEDKIEDALIASLL